MARWVQFGFVAIMALGLGVYLGSQGDRSLEKLVEIEEESWHSALSSAEPLPSHEPALAELPVAENEEIEEKASKISGNSDSSLQAKLEIQEAKQSVFSLLKENKRFRKEVLDLENQIRRLTHSLADVKLENDRLRIQIRGFQDQRDEVSIPGPNIPEVCSVIDINEELNLVVLNRGLEDGIQHRMQLSVVRDDSRIAGLEAVNVRSRITGAAITYLKENETIRAGDRAIPARN